MGIRGIFGAWIVVLCCLCLVKSYGAETDTAVAAGLQAAPNAIADRPATKSEIVNPFASFTFGMENLSAPEQVELLGELGYQGLVIGALGDKDYLQTIQAYSRVPDIQNGAFQVYAILWWSKAREGYDSAWLDKVLVEAAKMKAALWVVVEGPPLQEREATLKLLNAAADQCAAHGVEMVLYPHSGCVFEDTLEALNIHALLKRPEVKVSLHICHELKAGKWQQVAQTVGKAAPHLSLVSVSGANTAAINNPGWDDSIMPLDEGDLNLHPLLLALMEARYQGPIVLHTYGIKQNPQVHLKRSHDWWQTLTTRLHIERRPHGQ